MKTTPYFSLASTFSNSLSCSKLKNNLLRFLSAVILFFSFVGGSWGQVSVSATSGTTGPTAYTTVSAAFTAINTGTHQGIITINITGNTTEPTSPTALLKSSSPSNYSAVTIKPSGGNFSINGTATANYGIINLRGADNVTIDGDDPSTSGVRNLTIQFTATATTNHTAVIRISSNSTTGLDGANNNTVKNCILIGSRTTTGTNNIHGINFSDNNTGSLNMTSSGGASSINNIIENNLITRVVTGIWANGLSGYALSGLQIKNNVFGDGTLAGNPATRGINLVHSASSTNTPAIISGNDIQVGDPGTTGYTSSIAGIEIGTGNYGSLIYNNNIHDVVNQTSAGYHAIGIYITGSTGTDQLKIYNNFIRDMLASRYSSVITTVGQNHGIFFSAGATNVSIDNNTIVLSKNCTTSPTTVVSNYISTCVAASVSGVTIINLRNNIFVNTQTSTESYGIYTVSNSNISSGTMDNNCFWIPNGKVGYYNSASRTTLADWKSATGKDLNSISLNPPFVSATDLHINNSSATLLESGGMTTSFNTDFDGNSRPGPSGSINGGGFNFDIGADEFDGLPNFCAAPTSLAASASSTAQSTTSISGSFTAASSTPSGYLVVRTLTNSQPTPSNGISYTVGSNAIGYIEYVGASAGSWTSTTLTTSTTYYFWVFSYNSTPGTCFGPVYSSSATNFSSSTSSCPGTSLSGLSYATNPASYCISSAISSNLATLSASAGSITYSVTPSLPTGLSLSSSTGSISGTPTSAVSAADYTITADNGCTSTTAILNLATLALPTAPTSSAGSLAGNYGFTANWSAASGASAYLLDVSTSSSFTSMLSGYDALNVGTVTTYAVTGLGSGTTYYYRVRSTNGTCNSLNSSTITIATTALTSLATGDWNSGTTWSGGQVPTCNDNVTIQSTHNVTVNSSSNVSRNLTIASGGTLTIASGDLTVGCTLNNTPLTNNGTLTVTGGTLNVNGYISSSGTFVQNNGNINVDPNASGVTANSTTSSQYTLNLSGTVQWTGGILTLIDPPATTSSSHYSIYYNSANSYDCIGHTIVFGDGVSSTPGGNAIGFLIYNYVGSGRLNFGSAIINGPSSGTAASANRIVQQISYSNFFNGNFTVNSGAEFVNTNITVGGDVTVNSGGILTSTATLNLAKPSGSSSAVASTSAQSIGGSGTFRNLATSSTASLTSLTINNTSSAGVTISTPLSISGTLTMTAGKINTSSTNLLTLGTTSAAGTLSYTAGQITGPFARTFAASRTASGTIDATTLFPVGDGTTYLPCYIDPTTTSGGSVVMCGQAFSVNNGTGGSGVASTLASKRWEALISSGSAYFTNSYIQLNHSGIATGNVIAQSSSAGGTYNSITPSSTVVNATSIKTASGILAASYSGYFTYAAPGPAITSFTPSSTCSNTIATITISGTNLTSATSVTLNGEACTITNNTSTSITVTTDATPQAGNIVVTTAANSVTSGSALSLYTLPTVTATSDANNNTVCSGTSVILSGGGASTYSWDNSAGSTSSVTVTPSSTTTYTVSGTDANNCVNTASVTIAVNLIVAITSQPSNSIVLPGADATFTVSATGTGLSYQWQVSTDNGATWTNASGTSTNASYTESAVASGSTGNQYRCIVSGTAPCSSQTSNAATLTVSSTAIAAHPQDQVICSSSGTASFSVTTTGSTPTYQWQVSTDGGSTWSDISGETNSSLSLTGLTVTSNTYKYRCSLNSGSINSNAALLTVYAAPTISAQPTDLTVCSNATSGTITISASGNGSTLSYQWQVSTDGGNNWSNVSGSNVSGATSSTLSFSSFTNSMDGNKYKVVLNTSSPCSTVTSDVVTLSVTGYTVSASASSICLGASFTLTETPTSTAPTLSYSWACATTGSGATVAVTTNPATITPTATGTFTYTLTTTGGSCTLTSTQAITVNANPSITSVTASPSSVCSGSSVSLSAASVSASTGTAVIGSGNTQGANNTTFVRVGNTVGNQFKNQYLFTAAELNAAGLTSGNITSLAFDVFVSGGGTVSNLTFKLGTTSLTNLTSTYVSGLTQVYTVGTYPATGVLQVGLQTVTFNTPFFWDGISNLVLEACSQLATSGTAGDLRSGTTTFVSTITNNPSTTACGSSTGAGTVSVRPNFTFGGQVGTNNAANFSWSWNTTPTLTSATGTTTASNNTNAGVSQVYTATATNASTGCSTSLSATAITINPLPSTPTANGTTICGPQNATCSVTTASSLTGSTYNWYTVPTGGTAISGQTGSSLSTYLVSATTTYYVSELNSGCESGRVAVTQTVSTPPSISTSVSTATICAGQSTSLSASSSNSGYTYSWNNNGGSGATVSVSPTATTTYTVTGTDASGGINNGCSATATTTVTVNPVPSAVTISPTSVSICSGSTTQLTGSPALVANVTGYSTNVSTGATLMDVTGGTDLIGQNQDDLASALANIGFNFVYEGTTYTQFSANSNGLLRLGGTVISNDWSNALADVSDDPKIMPLWDDISTGTSGYVRYKVNGSSPNRILVVEFFGRVDATETSASTSKFQTLFYETSNLIEFVYGPSSVTSLSSATIGISGIVNTNYMARKNVNNNNFGASSAAETIATWPGEGTKYTFIPTPTYTWSGGPITSGGSTATATVNPTSTTTYTLTSTNGLGCSVSTTAIVTVNQPTITWTGATSTDPTVASNWNPSGVPCTVSDVTIPSGLTNYPIYSSLTISSGSTYTLQSGAQLTLTGALTNNGTMTIESGATFKQGTSVTGTGTYNVKQTIDNGAGSGTTLSGRFWYLGSPLACTRSSSFGTSGSLNKVWEFTNGAYANVADNASLDPTKGYVHRRSDASQTLTFSGQNLYAQEVTLSLSNNAGTYAGWHLVSNPYTAYLNWAQVIGSNLTSNISSTYYIRSYNLNSQDVDALISYNASSGLESNTSSFSLSSSTAQYIAPLQAFWVKVPPTSTLSSTAGALRLERAFTSHQTGTLKNTGVYPVLARVNLYNGTKYDQALVYMNEFMTNASDQNDSEKMFVSGVASIYTMASGKKLVMNGLKNNKKKISVPLYLELPTSKVYQLQLSEYIMEDGLILLEDKQEGTIQDFTIHDVYSFYANSGVLQNRFVLHFYMPDAGVSAQGPSNSWVEEESAINEGGSILVSSNGRGKVTITQDIDATPSEKGSVAVRDAAGREIYNGQLTGSATNLELEAPSGIYFVSVELNGQVEVKKIFVQQ